VYFLQKLARQLRERDEHLSDVMGKEGCPRGRESKYLEAVYDRRRVTVPCGPNGIVMYRMIVCRYRLEGRRMSVRKSAARRAEDVANLEVRESAGGYYEKVIGIKVSKCQRLLLHGAPFEVFALGSRGSVPSAAWPQSLA
jgi:hypothetical protein